jgi:DNA-binding IclR family transcriptional regulator
MPRTGQPSTRDVESTVRAVAVLDALAEGGELGTTDLSRRTGISASTVSRQLGTLARLGLVEHVAATGRYRLGVRVLRLANAVLGRLNLRDVARPHLEELVREIGEAGTLSIPGDGDAITVDFVPSDRYLQGVTRLGRPSIGHASSAGKVMLAFGNVPLPRGRLASYAPRTITDPGALAEEIERVRSQGWAEAVEEREVGLSAIAAPVWGSTGELAAIVALQGPTSRFDEDAMRAALPLLLDCAKRTSLALGWHSSPGPDPALAVWPDPELGSDRKV